MFANTIGTASEPRNVNRSFDELRRTAGLEWLHLHGTCRTPSPRYLLDQGEEMRTVMDLLDHSTIWPPTPADMYCRHGHGWPGRRWIWRSGRNQRERLAVLPPLVNGYWCWWSLGESNS